MWSPAPSSVDPLTDITVKGGTISVPSIRDLLTRERIVDSIQPSTTLSISQWSADRASWCCATYGHMHFLSSPDRGLDQLRWLPRVIFCQCFKNHLGWNHCFYLLLVVVRILWAWHHCFVIPNCEISSPLGTFNSNKVRQKAEQNILRKKRLNGIEQWIEKKFQIDFFLYFELLTVIGSNLL